MKMSCPSNASDASKCPVARALGYYAELITLIARVFMAHIFWKSGMIMYAYYLNGDFGRQVEIFREGLGLPFPAVFAWFTMIAEITLAFLLCIGLFGRAAAFILMVVTAIIEFGQISNIDHVYWFIILSFILIRGSGKISLDRLFCNRMKGHCSAPAVQAPAAKSKTTAVKPKNNRKK